MNAQHNGPILFVDDEVLFVKAALKIMRRAGLDACGSHTLQDAREMIARQPPALVLLDVRLPDGSGLELLDELSRQNASPPVVLLTAFGDVDDAVRAMKLGAVDYLQKPCDMEQIVDLARRLLSEQSSRNATADEPSHAGDVAEDASDHSAELIGDSAAMQELCKQVARIGTLSRRSALPPPTVLLTGETGVGKGLVARYLHEHSGRSSAPFVQVDCAALPRELIESELFGHIKGSFTGALRDKAGLIEQAAGGTVFLDEVGELPIDLQSKLLAVLDRRRARRVGSNSEFTTDAWFITATNRDLAKLSLSGEFRSDLYYRLNPLTIQIPPLRERGDDVLQLARRYLQRFCRQYDLQLRLSPAAEKHLSAHRWPGNVRELIGVIERAVYAAHDELITPQQLHLQDSDEPPLLGAEDLPSLREAEVDMIQRALDDTDGNVSEAARRLGMTRMMLRYRIQKFGLSTKSDAQ